MSQKILKSVSIVVQLDELKGSVNAMMVPSFRNPGKWIYSGNYRTAKKKVERFLDTHYSHLKDYLADHPEFYYTTVKYIAWDNWLTKSSKYRKLRKKDVSNFTKNAEDVIFAFLGVDDSSIIDSQVQKGITKPGESVSLQCVIELYEMDPRVLERNSSDIRQDLDKTIS